MLLAAVTSHKWLAILTWFIKVLQLLNLDRLITRLPVLPQLLRRQLAGIPRIKASTGYQPGALLQPFNCGEQPLGRVALFTGCVMDHWYRTVHEATIRVLRWNGYTVQIFAEQSCCGALHTHTGLADQGAGMARGCLDSAHGKGLDALVVDSAGCGQQLKENRPLGANYNVYDVAEWLAPRLNHAPKERLSQSVTYDPPCHLLYTQGISEAPLSLLKASCHNLVTAQDAEMCCGNAGLYSVYQGQLSASVTEMKVANLIKCQAEIVVTGNPGCQMQIQAGLIMAGSTMQVMHLVEVLDSAYQREIKYREVFKIEV
jgi:glycolate oxidase iron-sulfur subunit